MRVCMRASMQELARRSGSWLHTGNTYLPSPVSPSATASPSARKPRLANSLILARTSPAISPLLCAFRSTTWGVAHACRTDQQGLRWWRGEVVYKTEEPQQQRSAFCNDCLISSLDSQAAAT